MANETATRRGLGRGLSALIGEDTGALAPAERSGRGPEIVPIDLIEPNRFQPRSIFDEEKLEELAASIRERGILQPILVRPARAPGRYEIVAGERRWRAAQRAQLHEVPVVLREVSDAEALELAVLENVQRADLNPMEEAHGYEKLMYEFGYTQEALARLLGKSRSHIANTLRLLNLPDAVQTWLADGLLTPGHARALINAPHSLHLGRRIVTEGLSVRQAEALARAESNPPRARKAGAQPRDADTRALEGDVSAALGMKVSINHQGEGGEVRIAYKSLEELDELCGRLTAQSPED
jgi:ParB family chromosome partitioning protein